MKYFEDNRYEGMELMPLNNFLGKSFQILQSNMFFHQACEDADCEKHRIKLAESAYLVIAICEAVISRVPEDERERALADIAGDVKPLDFDGLFESILANLFH